MGQSEWPQVCVVLINYYVYSLAPGIYSEGRSQRYVGLAFDDITFQKDSVSAGFDN